MECRKTGWVRGSTPLRHCTDWFLGALITFAAPLRGENRCNPIQTFFNSYNKYLTMEYTIKIEILTYIQALSFVALAIFSCIALLLVSDPDTVKNHVSAVYPWIAAAGFSAFIMGISLWIHTRIRRKHWNDARAYERRTRTGGSKRHP